MEYSFTLIIKCTECGTRYEPPQASSHAYADPMPGDEGSHVVSIRVRPRCPACNALVDLLQHARRTETRKRLEL
jgi:hypothetical protein